MTGRVEAGKIRVRHIGLFVYLVYMLWIVLVEWINFIPKVLLGKNLQMGIAEAAAACGVAAILCAVRSRIQFDLKKPERGVVIGSLIMAVYGLSISVFPDSGFDTLNYHIIAQNPKFENFFVEDFGYGNFQVWGFRLCDRMFFYFRELLGYRYGTLLNTTAIIISFTLVMDILKTLTGENEVGKNGAGKNEAGTKEAAGRVQRIVCNRTLWALGIVLPLDTIMIFGSYYVDVATLPVGLFIISTIIDSVKASSAPTATSLKIAVFAVSCGFLVGGKMTNIVYAAPCVIIYVLINFRSFRVRDWITSILLGISCFSEYLVFNLICTGNPVFPYFNTFFRSEYYPLEDFKDPRWGGTNAFEKTFWAVYAAVRPDYRQSEIYDMGSFLLLLGIISGAALMVYGVIRLIGKAAIKRKIGNGQADAQRLSVAGSIIENTADENTTGKKTVNENTISKNISDENTTDKKIVNDKTISKNIPDENPTGKKIVNENTISKKIADGYTTSIKSVNEKFVGKAFIDKQIFIILAITVISAILWGFTTGVSRYYIFGRILWGMIAYYVVRKVVTSRPGAVTYALSSIFSLIIIVCMAWNFALSTAIGGWSVKWRTFERFRNELSQVFRDRYPKENTGIEMFVITDSKAMGLAELIEPEAYTFFLGYDAGPETDEDAILREKFEEYGYGIDLKKTEALEEYGYGIALQKAEVFDFTGYSDALAAKGFSSGPVTEYDTPLGVYKGIRLKATDQ
ncbi:MAG: hypothetical protein K6E91_09450 [Butyrivibrio sp.]|nr:hypothetical protein [Butyrivibrio sp.]